MAKTKALVPRAGIEGLRLFDDNAIELDGWTLRHQTAVPQGKPTPKQTQAVLAFVSAAVESSPYWVGDIIGYCENRADYRDTLDQVIAVVGLAEKTVHNIVSIAQRVAPAERALSPSMNHSGVVASMVVADQRVWLERARTEGWNEREFRLEVRAAKRRGILTDQADLAGQFRVWYVDYPWLYSQAQPSGVSAQSHYPGMDVEDGLAMGHALQAHTLPDAVLFWWVTAPMLYYATDPDKGPDSYRLIRAWGFEPKTGMVWDKVRHNFGNYTSVRHEHLIIATRGSCTPDRPTPQPDSVVTEQRDGEHSEKPRLFRRIIEKLYDGPYVELFAREPAKGWTCWGNQLLQDVKARH